MNLSRLEKRFDLARYLEQFEGTMVGDNFVTACPRCDGEQKLYVLTKDKHDTNGQLIRRGVWLCYKCNDTADEGGRGRTCLSLIEWMEDLSFVEAARRLAEGGTSAEADFIGTIEKLLSEFEAVDSQDEIPTVKLPEGFKPITETAYPPYCAERGISAERAMRYRLGFVLRGYCANRLVAPVYFGSKLVGFQARYMKRVPPISKKTGKRISKTKHAKGAKMSRVLYNWNEAKRAKRLVLVESPWAAIHLGATCAATFGKNLSSAQIELILQSDAKELVLMWDRDDDHKAGKGGFERSLAFAAKLSGLIPVKVVQMPDERDPDELPIGVVRRLIDRAQVVTSTSAWEGRIARRLGR